jgi:hypothetical protein
MGHSQTEKTRNHERIVRTALTEELRNAFRLIADLIPSKDAGTARSGAIVTLSALVGAIELSRAVSDEALSREILKSVGELLKKQAQRTSRQKAKAQDPLRQNDEQRDQRCVFKTEANRTAPVREAVISVPTRSRSRTR